MFGGSNSIDFQNPFGSAATPAQINIIARPSNNTVGFDTISFKNNVYINGLIYSHGEVYSRCPNTNFVVRGAIITYNDPDQTGVVHNGDFEGDSCVTNFSMRLDPSQFDTNPPPGFAALFGSGGAPRANKLLLFAALLVKDSADHSKPPWPPNSFAKSISHEKRYGGQPEYHAWFDSRTKERPLPLGCGSGLELPAVTGLKPPASARLR